MTVAVLVETGFVGTFTSVLHEMGNETHHCLAVLIMEARQLGLKAMTAD
jgi:hypothetical protein